MYVKMKKDPIVSVVLPVYNGEKYIKESVDSILNQTFTDFELLIIDNASVDSTKLIIKSYSDKRIRLIENASNKGLVYSLNLGINLARGEFIARMDADDISLPARFEKQIAFLQQYPHIIACGTGFVFLYPNGDTSSLLGNFSTPDDIRVDMHVSCPFCHPSMMIRRELIKKYNLKYIDEYCSAEDYKLWTQMCQLGDMGNVAEKLLLYRVNDECMSSYCSQKQKMLSQKIRHEYANQYGINSKYTLLEALNESIPTKDLEIVLSAYKTIADTASSATDFTSCYRSLVKKYFKLLPIYIRIGKIKEYSKYLTFLGIIKTLIKI